MKALKVVISVIIVVVSIGLVVFIGASMYAVTTINLLSNSVYYAQRMPHKEGTEPDLVMLIENMGEIYTPKIEGIRYDDDGANFIENSIDSSGHPTSFGEFGGGYHYSDKKMCPISLLRILSLSGFSTKIIKKLILQQLTKKR